MRRHTWIELNRWKMQEPEPEPDYVPVLIFIPFVLGLICLALALL